jgi:hypothetical protein
VALKRLGCALLLALLPACSKKVEPPRRTEPWLATPSASASAGPSFASSRFHFTSESLVRFSLPTRKAKPGGSVAISGGELLLDARQLEQTRGSVEVDLTKLTIDESTLPEAAELGGRSASELALDWLELGPNAAREKRDQFGKARFELVSIENLSSPALTGEGRAQRVRATVIGTLLLHGFRAPLRAEVWVELQRQPGRADRLSIRSAAPLVVPLGPHDIGARSPSGASDPLTAARAAEWVGKALRLELELAAEASSTVDK